VSSLLDETGLIHDQHRVTFAQLFNNILPQYIARGIRIPLCPLQQVLHAVGCRFTDPLSELPAVLALDRAHALQLRE